MGGRSALGQSDWLWNNGTIINDTEFGSSITESCQQMSWPLTYDDDINLRGKVCEEEAYFMCQVKCERFGLFVLMAFLIIQFNSIGIFSV